MANKYKLNLSKYSTHNIIKNNIGLNNIVLDIGCNEGYMGMVADMSNKFFGLDNNKKNILLARKVYKGAVFYDLNNLSNLPWKIEFDLIIFADVLEHVLNPEEVLKFFVNKYLKENGYVIISLPNIANWQVRLKLLIGKFDYTDTGILDKSHLHFFTFDTAKEFVINNRLVIVKEFSGSSIFGYIINTFPFFKRLFATDIILICKK